ERQRLERRPLDAGDRRDEIAVVELGERAETRRLIGGAVGAQLLEPILQVLRDLVGNLRPPRRGQWQVVNPTAHRVVPFRSHGSPPRQRYSLRNAVIGSIRVARHPGTALASTATLP